MANTMYAIGSPSEKQWLTDGGETGLRVVNTFYQAQFFPTLEDAEAHLVATKRYAAEFADEGFTDDQDLIEFVGDAQVFVVNCDIQRTE